MNNIYFDYAATTPCDPQVIKAMEPYFFEKFGNASSPHSLGQAAKKALEDSREVVARFLGAQPAELTFNSSATEGNNHVIFGIAKALKTQGKHIITTPIEHHSVLEPLHELEAQGFRISYCRVDDSGLVDVNHIHELINDQTILISVLHANNEIGTIQPIAQLGQMARNKGVVFLVDACQTVGHIPVNVNELQADFLTFSSHKFYGPKGIGGLYIRKGSAQPFSYILGGDQENNRRASTQNVAAAVGMAKAVELCQKQMKSEADLQIRLRDRLINEVPKIIEGTKVNGHLSNRLPNNAHFSFEDVEGESLLMSLDMNGICASMGSACTSGAMEPSHVLRAIGLSDELAYGSLRISLGRWTKEEDIDIFLEKLPQSIVSLRI